MKEFIWGLHSYFKAQACCHNIRIVEVVISDRIQLTKVSVFVKCVRNTL